MSLLVNIVIIIIIPLVFFFFFCISRKIYSFSSTCGRFAAARTGKVAKGFWVEIDFFGFWKEILQFQRILKRWEGFAFIFYVFLVHFKVQREEKHAGRALGALNYRIQGKLITLKGFWTIKAELLMFLFPSQRFQVLKVPFKTILTIL